jgi:soluble lytic murein transglycosylase
LWLRIEKAFKARRPSLAGYLAKKLEKPEDRRKVAQWVQAHRKPAESLKAMAKAADSPINRKILLHALDRLARRDSEKAMALWEDLRHRFDFSEDERGGIDRRIALSSALQHRPRAKELLARLPNRLKTDTVHLWLARINLRDEDWIGLIRSIEAMPPRLADEAEWVYWLARAYDEAGKEGRARELFSKLARRGSYYGFLAADRIDRPYAIEQQSIAGDQPVDENRLLEGNPNLLRARELFFVGRRDDARREWFQGLRKLDQKQIRQAASIAARWKWYDNAIKTVARTPHRKDYKLRFPMPFREQVLASAGQQDLDLSIVYGLMRRESLFDPLARSRVGALGLMQLMPTTARRVARRLGWNKPKTDDILEVGNNIRLGTSYFRSVLDRFDANIPLAAAAYNAGPKNVQRWLPKGEPLPADIWVETVPYKETRNYVQAVLAYATIFDKHLNRPVRISSRMAEVRPDYGSSTLR